MRLIPLRLKRQSSSERLRSVDNSGRRQPRPIHTLEMRTRSISCANMSMIVCTLTMRGLQELYKLYPVIHWTGIHWRRPASHISADGRNTDPGRLLSQSTWGTCDFCGPPSQQSFLEACSSPGRLPEFCMLSRGGRHWIEPSTRTLWFHRRCLHCARCQQQQKRPYRVSEHSPKPPPSFDSCLAEDPQGLIGTDLPLHKRFALAYGPVGQEVCAGWEGWTKGLQYEGIPCGDAVAYFEDPLKQTSYKPDHATRDPGVQSRLIGLASDSQRSAGARRAKCVEVGNNLHILLS